MDRRPLNQDELQLIDLIYKAAMDFSQWPIFLENVRQLSEAYHVNLIFYDFQNRLRGSLTSAGLPPPDLERYLSSFIDLDNQWARNAFSSAPLGIAIDHNQPIAADSKRLIKLMDPSLADYYSKEIPYGHRISSVLFRANHSHCGISLNQHRDHKPFSNKATILLNTLGPHLCRAIRIHNQLSAVSAEQRKLLDIIEKVNVGTALLDANATIILCNSEASRIFENHSGIRIGLGGRVYTANRCTQDVLSTLINTATRAVDDISQLARQTITVAVHGSVEIHPLKVSVLPLRRTEFASALPTSSVCTVMFLTDASRKCHVAPEYLRLAYDLSPTECTIATMLLEGHSIEKIAHLRGTSEETTRKQLKSVLSKTKTHSQRALMRILVNLSQDFAIPVA